MLANFFHHFSLQFSNFFVRKSTVRVIEDLANHWRTEMKSLSCLVLRVQTLLVLKCLLKNSFQLSIWPKTFFLANRQISCRQVSLIFYLFSKETYFVATIDNPSTKTARLANRMEESKINLTDLFFCFDATLSVRQIISKTELLFVYNREKKAALAFSNEAVCLLIKKSFNNCFARKSK